MIAANTEIFVVDKNGGDPVPILSGYDARWSPGGKLFVLLRGPENKGHDGSVWLATADGKQSKMLVRSGSRVADATWLPDGKSIAVSSVSGDKTAINRIYIDGSQPQGSQPQKISGNEWANWYEPCLSPDGKHLIAIKDCASGAKDGDTWCRGSSIVLLDLDTTKDKSLIAGVHYSVVWEKK